MTRSPSASPGLRRSLGVGDAVVIGLGSMIGAGIFAALGPAARAAGSGLLLGLAVAAVVAYCNAMSSARLAARYPASGGTYVYGRERLGDLVPDRRDALQGREVDQHLEAKPAPHTQGLHQPDSAFRRRPRGWKVLGFGVDQCDQCPGA